LKTSLGALQSQCLACNIKTIAKFSLKPSEMTNMESAAYLSTPKKPRYGHYRAIPEGSRKRSEKNEKVLFSEKTAHSLLSGRVNSQGLVPSVAIAKEGIGAKRKPLTRGAAKPLFLFLFS